MHCLFHHSEQCFCLPVNLATNLYNLLEYPLKMTTFSMVVCCFSLLYSNLYFVRLLRIVRNDPVVCTFSTYVQIFEIFISSQVYFQRTVVSEHGLWCCFFSWTDACVPGILVISTSSCSTNVSTSVWLIVIFMSSSTNCFVHVCFWNFELLRFLFWYFLFLLWWRPSRHSGPKWTGFARLDGFEHHLLF